MGSNSVSVAMCSRMHGPSPAFAITLGDGSVPCLDGFGRLDSFDDVNMDARHRPEALWFVAATLIRLEREKPCRSICTSYIHLPASSPPADSKGRGTGRYLLLPALQDERGKVVAARATCWPPMSTPCHGAGSLEHGPSSATRPRRNPGRVLVAPGAPQHSVPAADEQHNPEIHKMKRMKRAAVGLGSQIRFGIIDGMQRCRIKHLTAYINHPD